MSPRASGTATALTALAGFEARRLLRHPGLVVGVLPAVLLIRTAAGGSFLGDADGDVALALVPLAWATMVATNLAALRTRRHGTTELYDSTPTTARTRTLGHLASGLAAAAAAVAVLGAWLVVEVVKGSPGTPNPAELAIGPLLVAGAAALGVLAARWAPWAIVTAALLIATFVVQGELTSTRIGENSPFRWLAFADNSPGADDRQPFPGPVDWHVAYVAGMVALAWVLAVARHGLTRGVAVALAAVLGVTTLAAVAQTRPLSASEARRQAALLTNPAPVCEVRQGVRYCTSRDRTYLVDRWEGPAEAVLARTPAAVRARGLVVAQRDLNFVGNRLCETVPRLDLVPDRVRALLTPTDVWPADGAVHPGPDWPWDAECSFEDHGVALTAAVGAWAVGLPPARSAGPNCTATGQARSAVALWLAGQASPGGPAGLEAILEGSQPAPLVDFHNSVHWPSWGVDFAQADLAFALALLARPADEVGRIVLAEWDRLVDPTTPSSYLAAAAGVLLPRELPTLGRPGDGPCP